MKGSLFFAAAAASLFAYSSVEAQKVTAPIIVADNNAQTVTFDPGMRIERMVVGSDFQPAGTIPAPYVFLQNQFIRMNESGAGTFSFRSFTPAAPIQSDDVVLHGPPTTDPGAGWDTFSTTACVSEITILLYNPTANGNVVFDLELRVHPWNGVFGTGAMLPAYTQNVTGIAMNANTLLFLTYIPANPIPMTKASFIAFAGANLPAGGLGWVIANSTPGNVAMLPGRGTFRVDPTAGAGSVYTTLPQGSFFIGIRGTHNFVGQVDLSKLSAGAQPVDPLLYQFDGDADGVDEGMRRNMIELEITNDSAAPFTRRITSYVDENGSFTFPVTGAISKVVARRLDNGLKVEFNRPDLPFWSTNPCDPTNGGTMRMLFGDVNGDGIINDDDLLEVLFNFGTSEL